MPRVRLLIATLLVVALPVGAEVAVDAPDLPTLIRASRAGDRDAQRLYGLRLLRGEGVEADPGRGRVLLELASDAGSPEASVALAKILGRGLFGIAADRRAARDRIVLAAKQGSEPARRWLAGHPEDEPIEVVVVGAPSPEPGAPEGRRILVFGQAGCPPCRFFEPIVAEVMDKHPEVGVEHVDLASPSGRELAKRYGVPGTPTTVLVDASGAELGRLVGAAPADQLEALVSRGP